MGQSSTDCACRQGEFVVALQFGCVAISGTGVRLLSQHLTISRFCVCYVGRLWIQWWGAPAHLGVAPTRCGPSCRVIGLSRFWPARHLSGDIKCPEAVLNPRSPLRPRCRTEAERAAMPVRLRVRQSPAHAGPQPIRIKLNQDQRGSGRDNGRSAPLTLALSPQGCIDRGHR